MKWAKIITVAVLGLAVLLSMTVFKPMGEGSEKYAREWTQNLNQHETLEDLKKSVKEIRSRTFENGEWIAGVCQDSHSSSSGGTAVVKDSRGNTKVYFGHVCGNNHLLGIFKSSKNLNEVFEKLNDCMEEQNLTRQEK